MEILQLDLASTPAHEVITNLAHAKAWDDATPGNLESMATLARVLIRPLLDRGEMLTADLRSLMTSGDSPWGLAVVSNVPHTSHPRRVFLLLGELLGRVIKV